MMNGAELNLLVYQFLEAVADDDDRVAVGIATLLPEEDRWPFVVTLGHRSLMIMTAAIGPDWREHLELQRIQCELQLSDDA